MTIIFNRGGNSNSSESGWAQYNDDQYTELSPLVIPTGQRVKLPNNAANIINSQLPTGVLEFYNGTTQKITPDSVGDSYMLRVNFKAFTDDNNGYAELQLDIGGTQGIILERGLNFPRGTGSSNVRSFSSSSLIYTLGQFVSNGGELFINNIRGTTSIYDISYVISRDHKAI